MIIKITAKTEAGKDAIEQHMKETSTKKNIKLMKKKKISQIYMDGVFIMRNDSIIIKKIISKLNHFIPKELNLKIEEQKQQIDQAMRENGAIKGKDYNLEVILNGN